MEMDEELKSSEPMQLICSIRECRGEIIGTAVLLGGVGDHKLDFEGAHLLRYNGSEEPFAMVHPTCFIQLFDEMMKLDEPNIALTVLASTVLEIREALQMW